MELEEQMRHYLNHITADAVVRCLREHALAAAEKPYRCPWWLRWFPPLRKWWDRREMIWYRERKHLHQKAAATYAAAACMANPELWTTAEGKKRSGR